MLLRIAPLPIALLPGPPALAALGLLAFLAAIGLGNARAQATPPLPAPEGPVLLTVSGQIAAANTPEGTARFDLAMLESLGIQLIRTTTIWTDGPQVFAGVPLHAVLDRLGVTEGVLDVRAINDYATEVPVTDAVPGGAIIAFRRNGKAMPVRDRGPLWLIYPFDDSPTWRTETVYGRSVWQLEKIHVR